MLQLGICLENPDLKRCVGWADCSQDFLFIYRHMKNAEKRTKYLNDATSALASIISSRQSFQEQRIALKHAEQSLSASKSMKALSIAGVVFIPLTYTSSLFSMTQQFMPGAEKFWIYFAVALPLMVVVMLAYVVLDWGYNGSDEWSVQSVVHSFRGKNWKALSHM